MDKERLGGSDAGGDEPVDLVSSVWRSANSEYRLHIGHSRTLAVIWMR